MRVSGRGPRKKETKRERLGNLRTNARRDKRNRADCDRREENGRFFYCARAFLKKHRRLRRCLCKGWFPPFFFSFFVFSWRCGTGERPETGRVRRRAQAARPLKGGGGRSGKGEKECGETAPAAGCAHGSHSTRVRHSFRVEAALRCRDSSAAGLEVEARAAPAGPPRRSQRTQRIQ